MEVYLNRIVFISLVFAVIYLIILKIYSCIKKISDDIESMRRRHHHPFCKDAEGYLAE
tara:strand:+ start:173 stop:346 length:174 start_codon:yes stop_codon:yes gene_type:complete